MGTTPADIASAIEEAVDNGDFDYDGIIIKNIDDTGSYYKGKSKLLGTDYIVFNSNQFKNADNTNPTENKDIRYSLSEQGEHPVKYGDYAVSGDDIRLHTEENIAPVAEKATNADVFPEDFAPITEEEANAQASENLASLDDADAPPEVAPTYYGDQVDPDSPFDWGEWDNVGDRKKKAYMYKNPERVLTEVRVKK